MDAETMTNEELDALADRLWEAWEASPPGADGFLPVAAAAVRWADERAQAKAEPVAPDHAEALAEALELAMEWNWLDDDARPSKTASICDAALTRYKERTNG
jgi:hypothetical protein